MRILTGIDVSMDRCGGSLIICDNWYSRMEMIGIEVRFLAMPNHQETWWQMSDVRFLPEVSREVFRTYVGRLEAEVKLHADEFKPDIVHCQHLNFGLSRAFVDCVDVPVLGICHGTDVQAAKRDELLNRNMNHIVASLDELVCPSKQMAADLFDQIGYTVDYQNIPHGIPERVHAYKWRGGKKEQLRILYAGRLVSWKGAHVLIEALSYGPNEACLTVVGDEDESGYFNHLSKLVDELDFCSRVNFVPRQPRVDLWKFMENFDIVAFPSVSLEAFSLTVIEAQAIGVPTVMSGTGGGIVEVGGPGARIVADNSAKKWGEIWKQIASNRDELKEMSTLGLENARRFSMKSNVDSLVALSAQSIS